MSFLLLFLSFQYPTTGPVLTQQPTHVAHGSSRVNGKKTNWSFTIPFFIAIIIVFVLCSVTILTLAMNAYND